MTVQFKMQFTVKCGFSKSWKSVHTTKKLTINMAIKNEDKKTPTFSKIEVIAEGWF